MRKIAALVLPASFVLVACGSGDEGQTPTLRVDGEDYPAACADVGRFRQAVETIAQKVSETGGYRLRVGWRWTPEGEIRYSATASISDLRVEYYDFQDFDGVSLWGDHARGGAWNDSLTDPPRSLEDVLCETLDELQERLALAKLLDSLGDNGTQSFFEAAVVATAHLVQERSLRVFLDIDDDGTAVARERYLVSLRAFELTDEADADSYLDAETFYAPVFSEHVDAAEYADGLRALLGRFNQQHPRLWGRYWEEELQRNKDRQP